MSYVVRGIPVEDSLVAAFMLQHFTISFGGRRAGPVQDEADQSHPIHTSGCQTRAFVFGVSPMVSWSLVAS